MEELRLWLRDAVRTGIMNVPQDPFKFNQNIIDLPSSINKLNSKQALKIVFYGNSIETGANSSGLSGPLVCTIHMWTIDQVSCGI